jgi:hypothetical protein
LLDSAFRSPSASYLSEHLLKNEFRDAGLPGQPQLFCNDVFVTHGSSYYRESGGYITSDFKSRLAAAGVVGDGSLDPLDLPSLIHSNPANWLSKVPEYASCSWMFNVPADSMTSVNFE